MYVVTTRSVSSYSLPIMLTITVMFSNGHGRSIPRARRAALEPFHLPAEDGYLFVELFLRQV